MNPTQLYGVVPHTMYMCCLPYVWVGLELYVETKCCVSYSFDSICGAYESKEGHQQTLHFVPLTTRALQTPHLVLLTTQAPVVMPQPNSIKEKKERQRSDFLDPPHAPPTPFTTTTHHTPLSPFLAGQSKWSLHFFFFFS